MQGREKERERESESKRKNAMPIRREAEGGQPGQRERRKERCMLSNVAPACRRRSLTGRAKKKMKGDLGQPQEEEEELEKKRRRKNYKKIKARITLPKPPKKAKMDRTLENARGVSGKKILQKTPNISPYFQTPNANKKSLDSPSRGEQKFSPNCPSKKTG